MSFELPVTGQWLFRGFLTHKSPVHQCGQPDQQIEQCSHGAPKADRADHGYLQVHEIYAGQQCNTGERQQHSIERNAAQVHLLERQQRHNKQRCIADYANKSHWNTEKQRVGTTLYSFAAAADRADDRPAGDALKRQVCRIQQP